MCSYYSQKGGLPARTDITTDRAVFNEARSVTLRGVMINYFAINLPCKDMNRDAKLYGMGGSYQ